MGRHTNSELPAAAGSEPRPASAADAGSPFPAAHPTPSRPARPVVTRRGAVGLIGTAAAVTAVSATAVVAAPGATRQVLDRLAGAGTNPAGDAVASSARLTGTAGSAALTSGGTSPPTAAVDFQSSGGKAPTAVATAVRQPPTILPLDAGLHLARRATWGPTPALVTSIRRLGAAGWLTHQLRPATIKDPLVDRLLARYESLGKTPAQLRVLNKAHEKTDFWYTYSQLEQATMIRWAWSNRQLFEVVVDFFHNRLHVPGPFDKSRETLHHYDSNVIRKHAFGRFEAMVWAMLTHPAMITYLDNQQNTKNGGNQNLGRELLELHTVGVNAGYTQADVVAAARLLTGLSFDGDKATMVYRPEQHYVGKVKVFGRVFPNTTAAGGLTAMRDLVKYLTHHPRTAQYLALDLARRFVSDAPPQALVNRLAKTYLANDTAITPMLRQLFTSPEFRASVGQKYRRPMELTLATIRVLGISPAADWTAVRRSLGDLRIGMEQMGQTPLGHFAPDGYEDFAQPWLSSVGTLSRWNMEMSLVAGWNKGVSKPAVSSWLTGATTYGAAVDKLALRLLLQRPTPAQRAAILAFLGKAATDQLPATARTSDYNLLVRAPALLLGAPNHQLR